MVNENIIEEWCNRVASELYTRKFFDVQECKDYAKVIMKLAISEILNNQLSEFHKERAELVAKKSKERTNTYDARIAAINSAIKNRNNSMHLFETEKEYQALKGFLKKEGCQDLLNKFYDSLKKTT